MINSSFFSFLCFCVTFFIVVDLQLPSFSGSPFGDRTFVIG